MAENAKPRLKVKIKEKILENFDNSEAILDHIMGMYLLLVINMVMEEHEPKDHDDDQNEKSFKVRGKKMLKKSKKVQSQI